MFGCSPSGRITMFILKIVEVPQTDLFSVQIIHAETKGILQHKLVEKENVGEYVQHAIDFKTLAGLVNASTKEKKE